MNPGSLRRNSELFGFSGWQGKSDSEHHPCLEICRQEFQNGGSGDDMVG